MVSEKDKDPPITALNIYKRGPNAHTSPNARSKPNPDTGIKIQKDFLAQPKIK
jgi:hypothetical protein